MSLRAACRIMGISGSSLRYKKAPDRNAGLKIRLVQVARPGVGYRTAWGNLKEEFRPLNRKRVERLWKVMGLSLKKKVKRRRKGSALPGRASAPNQIWSLDFIHDSCLSGTRLKILVVVDEFTRECLALEAHTSIKARGVKAILASLFATRGKPELLRSDNGPEFVARSLTMWLAVLGIQSRFIQPGSPWQNGIVESFNGKLRAEFLNAEVFHNLADAQLKLRLWQRFYNEERPHSSLGYQTPTTYKSQALKTQQKEKLYS